MEHHNAAATLSELGNETRLAIYRYLVQVGPEGAPVGEIQEALNVPASTLSHHLSRMHDVGLIHRNKVVRSIICSANTAHLQTIITYLQEKCCEDHACYTHEHGEDGHVPDHLPSSYSDSQDKQKEPA